MIEIIRNLVYCKKCRTVLESKHVHDFAQCKCGNFTDGGHEYARRGGDINALIDLSTYKDENGKVENNFSKALHTSNGTVVDDLLEWKIKDDALKAKKSEE